MFVPKDKVGKKCQKCGHSRQHHATANPPPLPSRISAGPAPSSSQLPPKTNPVRDLLHKVKKQNTGTASASTEASSSSTVEDIARKEAIQGFCPTFSSSVLPTRHMATGKALLGDPLLPAPGRKSSAGEKTQRIGEIILLPDGTQRDEYPNKCYIAELRHHGLAVTQDGDGNALQINPAWTSQEIDEYICQAIPDPFPFLDSVAPAPPGKLQYVLLEREIQCLIPWKKRHQQPINGGDLIRAVSGKRGSAQSSRLHFEGVYKDWRLTNEHVEEGTIAMYEASVVSADDDADRSASPSDVGTPAPELYNKGKQRAQVEYGYASSDSEPVFTDNSNTESSHYCYVPTTSTPICCSIRLSSKCAPSPTPMGNKKRGKTGNASYVVPEDDVNDDFPFPSMQHTANTARLPLTQPVLAANPTPVHSADLITAIAAASSPHSDPQPATPIGSPVPKVSSLPAPSTPKRNPWAFEPQELRVPVSTSK
ncbi:hypothetical protein C8T65DRAFT_747688 [Cerioporus squamosus]|nr:hypothetical protein C8T65DRAFT_747688 [Cerioporus squamosus]